MIVQNLSTIFSPFSSVDFNYMKRVLEKAQEGFERGEIPIAAAIVYQNCIIALEHNWVEKRQIATAHAEMLVIEKASAILGDWRLTECTLYSSLEPCIMCMGAIMQARVKRLVWGAKDIRLGGCGSFLHVAAQAHPMHQIKISSGLFEKEAGDLLINFFQKRRRERDKRECEGDKREFGASTGPVSQASTS
ncbi:tRNA-specific adenosine deaminase [Candidatus Aerophobetes bacterium]|uniref:tRNA-specific adenosine deaminase n=1 Tax=Aerophobetes bacterium TaxID=2030807 RepID=A0A2A4X0N6_UNCAE|nr:MAG: tRNA-specific adenosine deaminase [Candidatus Aerophobetes bacterium]